MHHQPRVAFGLRAITPVVMNPVPVEGECRVAEQQQVIRMNRALPGSVRGADPLVRSRPPGRPTINDIVLLLQREPRRRADFMPYDTNTSAPLRPCFSWMLTMRETRVIASPTRSAW